MITQCQQLALSKAGGIVPRPSDQLALANKKKDKEPRSYHVSIYMFWYLFWFIWSLQLFKRSSCFFLFVLTVGFKHGGPFLLNIIGAKAIWSDGTRQCAGWLDRGDQEAHEWESGKPALLCVDHTPKAAIVYYDTWLKLLFCSQDGVFFGGNCVCPSTCCKEGCSRRRFLRPWE